jgi:hypothetical protein
VEKDENGPAPGRCSEGSNEIAADALRPWSETDLRDVFISHAGIDTEQYVYPLLVAFEARGITYWVSEAEILWGDSLVGKINDGLASARYVVVLITDAFLERQWTETELNTAVSLEVSSGEVVVLPIIAADIETVFRKYPLLRNKVYVRWDLGVEKIADELRVRLGTAPREPAGLRRAVVRKYHELIEDAEASGPIPIRACPSCGSADLRGSSLEGRGDHIYYTLTCEDCGWTEWSE